jgi:phosphatidylinositol phospholipase C gamma-1
VIKINFIDKNMQINEAKFLQNGKSGYVLKPSYMRKTSDYNPSYCSLSDEDPVSLVVKVLINYLFLIRRE